MPSNPLFDTRIYNIPILAKSHFATSNFSSFHLQLFCATFSQRDYGRLTGDEAFPLTPPGYLEAYVVFDVVIRRKGRQVCMCVFVWCAVGIGA